jgi:hypothetical protein
VCRTQGSSHEAGGVVYLAINMLMMVYAQIADRAIFTLFGFAGILLLAYGMLSYIIIVIVIVIIVVLIIVIVVVLFLINC